MAKITNVQKFHRKNSNVLMLEFTPSCSNNEVNMMTTRTVQYCVCYLLSVISGTLALVKSHLCMRWVRLTMLLATAASPVPMKAPAEK